MRILRAAFVMLLLVSMMAVAGPALASHKHSIVTPGTTATDIARGNTCAEEGSAQYHVIHDNLHARPDLAADTVANLTDGRVTVVVLGDC